MSRIDARIEVPVDVAHLLLFHPDDLAHAAGWPMAWYAEDFVYRVESGAGRLAAWSTCNDGSFVVRFTDGNLLDRERHYVGGRWTFPITVSHGRLYLDNTDALPSEAQMSHACDLPDNWIDVPNGEYAVMVTGIEWSAEPGVAEDGHDGLPDYVVQFTSADQAIEPARRPPTIPPWRGSIAEDTPSRGDGDTAKPVDTRRSYPAFALANVAPVGCSFSLLDEVEIGRAISRSVPSREVFEMLFVVAPRLAIGELAVIAFVTGWGSRDGQTRYDFRSEATVRIVAIGGLWSRDAVDVASPVDDDYPPADALVSVKIEHVGGSTDEASAISMTELQDKVLRSVSDGALARLFGATAGYERLRVQSFRTRDDIARWLLCILPMDASERLAISMLPVNALANAVRTAMDVLEGSGWKLQPDR